MGSLSEHTTARPRGLDLVLLLHHETLETVDSFAAMLQRAWPTTIGRTVVILDNAAPAGLADFAERAIASRLPWARIKRVSLSNNLGFGRAVNVGVAAAESEFVAVFNPDGELDPVTLERLVHALDSEPRAVVAGAELVPFGRATDTAYNPPREEEWCPGGAGVFRRSSFLGLGGFDPLFFLYGEDVDLGIRARKAGLVSLVVPGAFYRHEIADPSRRRQFRRYRYHAKHELAVLHIHEGTGSALTGVLRKHQWLIRNLLFQQRRPAAAAGAFVGAWEYWMLFFACRDRRRRPWDGQRAASEGMLAAGPD